MLHRRGIQRSACALLVAGSILGLSACGSSTATPTTTTTTTTTTLPSPVGVTYTQPTGPDAFEGPVLRIPVAPLANGANVLPARPATQRIDIGTTKVAYRQFGSGPNLVLAMGEHGSMTWWDPTFLNDLAQNYRVTIFDDPAVGYSAAMTRPPSVETDGDVMAGLIASLGLSNVTVIGWGMGGEAALSMAERHPKIAIALVLVDTSMGGPTAIRPRAQVAQIIGTPTSTVAQVASVMFPTTSAGAAALEFWRTDIENVEPDDVLFSTVVNQAAAQNAFFRDARVSRLAHTVTLPTLIFQGARDLVFPEQNAVLLHAQLQRSSLIIDPAGGYASLFQDRTAFLGDLAAFVTATSPSTTTTTVP